MLWWRYSSQNKSFNPSSPKKVETHRIYTALPFMELLRAASLDKIIRMYPLYHEMDLSHFAERMDQLMKEAYPQTRLREHRSNCGLSQSELAAEADVPLRQIQLFEQGQRDINFNRAAPAE